MLTKYDDDNDETISAVDYICEGLDMCEENESEGRHKLFTVNGGDLDLRTWTIGVITSEVMAHDWKDDLVGGYFYRGIFTSQELQPYLTEAIAEWLRRRSQ